MKAKEPGPITKLFAALGVFWMVWLALVLIFGFPGPWGINR